MGRSDSSPGTRLQLFVSGADVQGRLKLIESPLRLGQTELHLTQVLPDIDLLAHASELSPDLQSLGNVGEPFREVAPPGIDEPQIVEHVRFARPIPLLLENSQRSSVPLLSLIRFETPPDPVEQERLGKAVAAGTGLAESRVVAIQRLLAVFEPVECPAQPVVRRHGALALFNLLPEVQGLAVLVGNLAQRLVVP